MLSAGQPRQRRDRTGSMVGELSVQARELTARLARSIQVDGRRRACGLAVGSTCRQGGHEDRDKHARPPSASKDPFHERGRRLYSISHEGHESLATKVTKNIRIQNSKRRAQSLKPEA